MSVREHQNTVEAARLLMEALLQASNFVGPVGDYTKFTPEANGAPPPPVEMPFDPLRVVALPRLEAVKVSGLDLRAAIEGRRSVRGYSEELLSLDELSWLLWCTQGVREVRGRQPNTARNVPSGGGCHPFETYLQVNRVEGLKPGIYRFLPLEHALVEVSLGDFREAVVAACGSQKFLAGAAVVFLWAFVPSRASFRYGSKVYKFFLEAGHICQNLYLGAEAVGCGVCAVAGYDMNEVHKVIGTGTDQYVIYVAGTGKKKIAYSG